MEQLRAVVGASVVMAGGEFRVLLEGLQLVLPLLLQLVRDPFELQDDCQWLTVDELFVPELFLPIFQRPDHQQNLPV